MTITMLDGTEVEVTHCDAGYPPGSCDKSLILNTTAVWFRPKAGVWHRSKWASAMKTADAIKRTDVSQLGNISDWREGDERPKASSSRASEAVFTKLPSK